MSRILLVFCLLAGAVRADDPPELVRRRQVSVDRMTVIMRQRIGAGGEYRENGVRQQILDRMRFVKKYPDRFLERQLKGKATVEFTLQSRTGRITEARLVTPSGNAEIDQAAMATVTAADPCRLKNAEPNIKVQCTFTYDENERGPVPATGQRGEVVTRFEGTKPAGTEAALESKFERDERARRELELRARLLEHLEQHKAPLPAAIAQECRPLVQATLDGMTGEVVDIRLAKSSGVPAADTAALTSVKQSSPFPAYGQAGRLHLDVILVYGASP